MLSIQGVDTSDKFGFLDKYDRDTTILDSMMYDGVLKAVGVSATILNGFSYKNPLGYMLFHSTNKLLDGIETVFFRFIHLENYDMQIGYEEYPSVASPERNICDYFMYPKELDACLYEMDAIEGYYEEVDGDMTSLYEMMKYFGIERSVLDEKMKHLYEGANRHGIY